MTMLVIPLCSLADTVDTMLGKDIQTSSGQRSLSSSTILMTLFAILMLVSTSMAATTPAPSFFMLAFRRGLDSTRPPGVVGTSWYKGWSGRKAPDGPNGDKTIVTMVYYHEQTIAVVELGRNKTLRNCELIEVYDSIDIQDALKNLTSLNKPLEISFEDMMDLMSKCHDLELPEVLENPPVNSEVTDNRARSFTTNSATTRGARRSGQQQNRGLLSNAVANPFAIFNGIVPGTKWCGTGDIAQTFYDLGFDKELDRCCRTHDLCPIKIRSYQTRYSIKNDALFSKSHCDCDDALFRCLKQTKSATADVIGNIYFNIVQVPCLEHVDTPLPPSGKQGIEPMKFSQQRYAY